jgi:hypothetical protein
MGGSIGGGHEHGGSTFGLEGTQRGVELHGIAGGKMSYALGVANGNGIGGEVEETGTFDNNKSKDGYARLAYKLGGMRMDGETEDEGGVLQQSENWRDNSIRIGGFTYQGNLFFKGGKTFGEDGHAHGISPEGDPFIAQSSMTLKDFERYGFDADLYLRDLNLFGGIMRGVDRSTDPTGMMSDNEEWFTTWFAEGDYVLYPWLIGAVRYETVILKGTRDPKRVVPNITAQIRANLKTTMEASIDPDNTDQIPVRWGLDMAF